MKQRINASAMRQNRLLEKEIWNALSSPESSRPAIAIPDIDKSAPIIQMLARMGLCGREVFMPFFSIYLPKSLYLAH
tara:strand:+ start:188 stop:418 length:231 start_codon:yes stop_codon:yes gene_type:complete